MFVTVEVDIALRPWNCEGQMEGQTNIYEVHSSQLGSERPQQISWHLPAMLQVLDLKADINSKVIKSVIMLCQMSSMVHT